MLHIIHLDNSIRHRVGLRRCSSEQPIPDRVTQGDTKYRKKKKITFVYNHRKAPSVLKYRGTIHSHQHRLSPKTMQPSGQQTPHPMTEFLAAGGGTKQHAKVAKHANALHRLDAEVLELFRQIPLGLSDRILQLLRGGSLSLPRGLLATGLATNDTAHGVGPLLGSHALGRKGLGEGGRGIG